MNTNRKIILSSLKNWIISIYAVISVVVSFIQIGVIHISEIVYIVIFGYSILSLFVILIFRFNVKDDDFDVFKHNLLLIAELFTEEQCLDLKTIINNRYDTITKNNPEVVAEFHQPYEVYTTIQ